MAVAGGPLPLAPYRVLDLTERFGALCGRILGDLGAQVIKIERSGGDPARRLPPFADGLPGPDTGLSWWASNYNKESAVLDLGTDDGRAVLTALAAASDFVVESFPPGRMGEMELDYERLRRVNPSLVWVSITPYGSEGPRAGWAADDITLMAAGGWMHLAGNEDRAPLRCSAPQADPQAGVQAAMGAMIAHHRRRLTGRGQRVDVSMQAAVVNTLIEIPAMWEVGGKIARRGIRSEWGPLMQRWLFACKDGYVTWKWFVDRGRGRRNRGLMEWMRDEGADDGVADWDYEGLTLYKLTQERVDHLEDTVQCFFSTRTKAEIYREALARRFLSFPVHTPQDIVADPQMQARGFFRALKHPGREAPVLYPGPFVAGTAADYAPRLPPPRLGEHTLDALALAGIGRGEAVTLRGAGVI